MSERYRYTCECGHVSASDDATRAAELACLHNDAQRPAGTAYGDAPGHAQRANFRYVDHRLTIVE